jgi:hypothetical protein
VGLFQHFAVVFSPYFACSVVGGCRLPYLATVENKDNLYIENEIKKKPQFVYNFSSMYFLF